MKIKYSNLLVGLLLPLTTIYATDISLTPPNAKPGECYARVMSPAKYETVEEKVMVKEPTEEISIIPAQYETVEQKVAVTPEIKKLIPVPAKYKKMTETVEVKPAVRVWKTSLRKKALPVSQALLDAVKAQGLDLAHATAGTCYKEFFQPATYKIVEEDVIVQNERNETEIIPAQFETQEQKIEVIPPSKKVVDIPPKYEYTEEKVLIEEAKTVWKKGQNPAQKLSGATGEIMCLVKVPAKYKTIKKQVVTSPARTEVQEIPAEVKTVKVKHLVSAPTVKNTLVPAVHKTIKKKLPDTAASFMWTDAQTGADKPWRYTGHQVCLVETPAVTKDVEKVVLDTPATVKEEVIPAVYKTVKVEKLVTPAKEVKTPIEAEYKMVEKRKKLASTHVEWKRILCQTNMTKDVIKKLQTALNEKSYHTGKPDGVLGRGTRNALERYQKDNTLATGGITYETLNSLNIEL
ncbi:MAG TPA: peptidoglycan-binding protein [Epsilonproteobacteria bacterium]|nr:peptidoglycan-binding protein [Campylobacterota bacterium]